MTIEQNESLIYSYYNKQDKVQQNSESKYPIATRPVFKVTNYNLADFYDTNQDCVSPISAKAKMDFATTDLKGRAIEVKENIDQTEVREYKEVKPNWVNTIIDFD